ncbi:putative secreted protein (Por secretion system target) [Lacinutrix venerupis]|uniref:lamin tail domain-containing protein n=1 Tax=Lacinutrix venerupis TaxID=1486034 RepID=UPI000EAE5A61|nr:lamin tail domain-containing protein [Lacinutrix venerupis]RLJ65493.1 putative secreted protein (Por secretion system target) [Lacinutrix venerupis]
MKKNTILLILLFVCSIGISQTTVLYSENFNNQIHKGAVFNNTTNTTDIDLSGVDWSIDVSATTFQINDRFRVQGSNANGRFQGRDLDGFASWFSPVIDINGFTNVSLSLNAREYNNNADNDTLETLYSIDGGAWITVTEMNGLLFNTFNIATVSQTGLTGSTLQIQVIMNNNRNTERMEFDDVQVIGTNPVVPTITANPSVVTGMGYVEGEASVVEDSFTVQGYNLTTDILIDATSTNFEISTTSGTGFGNTISLTPNASNEVGLTTIYIRLVAGLTANTYNGSISATSLGATDRFIDAEGEVTTPIADCSEIIISEYFEPANAANEKYIELYNPTNVDIDLSNYRIAKYTNGSISPNSVANLTGIVNAYSTYLISKSGSTLCASGVADRCVTNNSMNFSGNDVMALQTINGENIDVIGIIGDNSNFAQNVNLKRNSDVKIPTVVYNASQWTSTSTATSNNNTATLGWHNNECLCTSSTTWETTGWNPIAPTASTAVIINAPYNTLTDGNITACSLTVNNGIILTVADNSFIDIESNIVVNGNGIINVQKNGSVVQNISKAKAAILDPANGVITVTKETAIANNWYEYTYWSSPVIGEQVQDVFFQSPTDRRFWYNAANYADLTMETANDGSAVPGQDNVDDNGDDWQLTAGTDVLLPGVGYATTLSQLPTFPNSFSHIFEGPFNNGTINVPVVRNDASTADKNYNFIGNPYPSAISVNAFFAENVASSGILDGEIYLWSQNTAPASNINGNSDLNFDTSDYAVINGTTGIAGGDGVIPSLFIPSGQGFFVNYSDSYGSTSGDVIFNNSMRVTGNNDQFFRASNNQDNTVQNTLWLNLTSDNGVRNQIAIGYLDTATAGYDGSFYDSSKITPVGLHAILYSIIPGNDKKFSIQGKATNDLNINEEIPLGINTNVDVPTIYTISIAQMEGDFLNNNTIYLEDALTNGIHDLSSSDYSFTSQVGEFNNRFKIVFQANTLSTEDFDASSQNLSIVELQDNNVQFSINSKELTIKNIEILDLLGRSIYQFRGSENKEVYNLSNLNSSVYIAKIELSNGKLIVKKAIKK